VQKTERATLVGRAPSRAVLLDERDFGGARVHRVDDRDVPGLAVGAARATVEDDQIAVNG
jgi:hypothetical protein